MALAILATCFLTVSCQEAEVCEEATAIALRIGIYKAEAEEETRLGVDSLTIYGIGREDSLIYHRANGVSLIELPMNPHRHESGYVFDFGGQPDTLWLTTQKEMHFISVACGFSLFYNITDINHTLNHLQQVSINQSFVTNAFDEHLKIFIPDPGIGD